MNETMSLVTALVGGAALGVLFFAGLWWTVRHGLSSEYPAFWFFSSLLLRTAFVLTGFYYIAMASGQKLLMCLCGFFVAHQIVRWRAQAAERKIIPDSGDPT
jgi:F1F0 ATPase subunit 2